MKRSRSKLISVIMPVYNARPFLREALNSLLWQTYTNWELIAVDDGSKDKSLEILETFAHKDRRIKVVRLNKNKGIFHALNLALQKSKGFYIARMDADDISLPERFEKQVEYLHKHKRIIAVGTQVELIDENGKNIGLKTFPTQAKKLYEMMMTMMAIQHPTLLTYASIMKKCPYENHIFAEDVSLFFRLLQFGSLGNVNEVLFQYRVRKNSNSLKDPKKTFYLTLHSRIKAIIEWSYRPTMRGIVLNVIQLLLITALPNNAILMLYELLRFKQIPFTKLLPRDILAFTRNK